MNKEAELEAKLIEETILRLEAEAMVERILEDVRRAKGNDSVILKEVTYTVTE